MSFKNESLPISDNKLYFQRMEIENTISALICKMETKYKTSTMVCGT
jgi:hypothetical protein